MNQETYLVTFFSAPVNPVNIVSTINRAQVFTACKSWLTQSLVVAHLRSMTNVIEDGLCVSRWFLHTVYVSSSIARTRWTPLGRPATTEQSAVVLSHRVAWVPCNARRHVTQTHTHTHTHTRCVAAVRRRLTSYRMTPLVAPLSVLFLPTPSRCTRVGPMFNIVVRLRSNVRLI